MDAFTLLFIVLGIALVVYIIAMIEAFTRSPGEKSPSKAEKKKKKWPPEEGSE